MTRSRTRVRRAVVAAAGAGALFLSGCSAGGGGNPDGAGPDEELPQQLSYEFGDAEASQGPAPAIDGASKGGTINVLQRDSYSHLDPAQIYTSDEGTLSTLIHRGLTTYKRSGEGEYTVVGDLATDSGRMSDGGKTWTYTLKDDLRFEDGTAITSEDIRHTVERMFAPYINEGPTFVQQWLANTTDATEWRDLLKGGPYGGDHLPDTLLETPDAKTVVFHFEEPVSDLPYALAMPGYSVVPAEEDSKQRYDKNPVCSGPYKIKEFKPGKSMTLVRNKEWEPETDPARHQYPKRFDIRFNVSFKDSTQRMIADTGENATTVSFNSQVDASHMQAVRTDPDVEKRSVAGYQGYVGVMNFNTDHLKKRKVRLAIAHALPNQSLVTAFGGSGGAEIAGNYISPTISGHEDTDPLGKKKNPQGNLDKAKKLLEGSGEKGMKLTFAYQNTPEWSEFSVAAAQNLEKVGFDVQKKPLNSDTYYDQIGKVDNPFDIFPTSWVADWPSMSTVVPPLYDGRQIEDGASNYSHYDDPETIKEIDRISEIKDQEQAAEEWMALADRILTEDVPQAPLIHYKAVQLHGSKIGGVVFSDILHGVQPTSLYVKK
jgi:peptide/nickel transport system substrate-binding protein